jgi:uncharacterized protein (TIGR02996 family)
MTEHDAFLAAICDNPDDDGPRLMYADWLEEHGDAAPSEFIRTQIEMAKLDVDDPHRSPLEQRACELMEEHPPDWLGSLRELPVRRRRWRRGFIDTVEMGPAEFLATADRLFAAAPVQTLRLFRANAADIRKVAASPHLARLRGLCLVLCSMQHAGMQALAESPYIHNLTALALGGSSVRIGDEGLATLAATPALANVTYLDLTNNGFCDIGIEALAGSPHLRRLNALHLNNNLVASEGLRLLAQSPVTTHLTTFSLLKGHLTDRRVEFLVEMPLFRRLKRLNLAENRLGPGAATALAKSRHLRGLTRLHLGRNPLGDEGVTALLDSPNRNPDAQLNLYGCAKVSRSTRARAVSVLGEKAFAEVTDWAGDSLRI